MMRRETNGLFLFFPILFVISSSHLSFGQNVSSKNKPRELVIIRSKDEYISSVKLDSSNKMMSLKNIDSQIVINLKYSTKDNFTGQVLYKKPMAFLRLPAAMAIKKISNELNDSGYALKIFDAYRPYSITQKMWNLIHDKRFVANPSKGSGHNRGTAVDVTLVDLHSGKDLPMGTEFDAFTPKASHQFSNLSPEVLRNRIFLKRMMIKYNFFPLKTEWWHYLYIQKNKNFELLDLSFEELKKIK